jgi:hypothetical protein
MTTPTRAAKARTEDHGGARRTTQTTRTTRPGTMSRPVCTAAIAPFAAYIALQLAPQSSPRVESGESEDRPKHQVSSFSQSSHQLLGRPVDRAWTHFDARQRTNPELRVGPGNDRCPQPGGSIDVGTVSY